MPSQPELIAQRCVHAIIEMASCRACADACPRDAWILDEEQLGFDPEACTGCGRCAAACPTDAIQPLAEPWLGQDRRGRRALFIACGPDPDEPGILPCIHAATPRQLLQAALAGAATLHLAAPDCNPCPQARPGLFQHFGQINRLLMESGRPPLRLNESAPETWRAERDRFQPLPEPDAARRGFLKSLAPPADETNEPEPSIHWPLPLAALLPASDQETLYPAAPKLNQTACTGCDACTRLCPTGALALAPEPAPEPAAYRITPALCTGCALCADLCQQHALTIETWTRAAPATIPLRENRCPRCGVRYHQPAANPQTEHCPICRKLEHRQKLFVVED